MRVIFSGLNGEVLNLWKMIVSPATGKIEGLPERLTTGSGHEQAPSCSSDGTLSFANVETEADAWVLPIDLNAGTPKGPLERITGRPVWRETLSLSAKWTIPGICLLSIGAAEYLAPGIGDRKRSECG